MSDLIGGLVGSLGIGRDQAEGAAGAVLGLIKQNGPEGALDGVVEQTPAAEGWMQKAAPALAGSSGGGGGFAGLAGSLLGGGGGGLGGLLAGASALQTVSTALEKLGIPGSVAVQAIPHVISFLKSRLGDQGFAALAGQIPLLKELAGSDGQEGGGGGGGGLAGALGKLF
jgi:hypothetical protein